jgi:dinuclear metal center YbgI/SA1388 family protein
MSQKRRMVDWGIARCRPRGYNPGAGGGLMQRAELEAYLNRFLEAERFRDYCPNGLQVEGRAEISRIATGVTASLAVVGRAAAAGADALLVHHGYFWRGEDPRLVGPRGRRIAALNAAALNLFAYHLPLDAHPGIGNNAELARVLGLEIEGWFGEQSVGAFGRLPAPMALGEFAALVGERLARAPLVVGDAARRVARVAWCTGAAQGYLEQALALGVDVYLSGEASEPTVHLARESGVAYVGAGHHATERYGIRALGEHLAREFGLEHRFIDEDNPV